MRDIKLSCKKSSCVPSQIKIGMNVLFTKFLNWLFIGLKGWTGGDFFQMGGVLAHVGDLATGSFFVFLAKLSKTTHIFEKSNKKSIKLFLSFRSQIFRTLNEILHKHIIFIPHSCGARCSGIRTTIFWFSNQYATN